MKNILLVEDEIIPVIMMKKYLENMGHRLVGVATDAEAAIKAVQQFRPDVILMDVHIAGHQDGIETIRAIREFSPAPVIYTMTRPDPSTLARINKTRNAVLLKKPLAEAELQAAIESCTAW